jgi:hypothetical protein
LLGLLDRKRLVEGCDGRTLEGAREEGEVYESRRGGQTDGGIGKVVEDAVGDEW